jgi:hypothetical protein
MEVDHEVERRTRACAARNEHLHGLAPGPVKVRAVPPSGFCTSRSCARVDSAMGDGFCEAAGGGCRCLSQCL